MFDRLLTIEVKIKSNLIAKVEVVVDAVDVAVASIHWMMQQRLFLRLASTGNEFGNVLENEFSVGF